MSEFNKLNDERYLCFSLGTEEYAMPLLDVREVIGVPEVTPIPNSPSYFLGIMNLRGQVISVMDLRKKLSVQPSQDAETSVIICDLGSVQVGVVVDSINSVSHPTSDELSERPQLESGKKNEYIVGVFKKKDHLVLIINIAKTLNLEDQNAVSHAQSVSKTKHAA